MDKKVEQKLATKLNLKKVVVKKLNTRTGIKALGRTYAACQTNNSCGSGCHTK